MMNCTLFIIVYCTTCRKEARQEADSAIKRSEVGRTGCDLKQVMQSFLNKEHGKWNCRIGLGRPLAGHSAACPTISVFSACFVWRQRVGCDFFCRLL
jgi:hypothetical protein